MGWFSDLMEDLDRPANAIQGYFVGAKRDDETRLEGLKRGWNQEENYDFEQLWDEDLADKGYYERGNLDRLSYVASGALNLLVDPLNVIGGGMFTKGVKGVDKAVKAGADVNPDAMKGFTASSVPNFIQGHYGKTVKTADIQEAMKKGMLFDSVKYTTPWQKGVLNQINAELGTKARIDQYQGLKKKTGMAKTASYGALNAMQNVLSPQARALYRSEGINKGLFELPYLSHKGSTDTELVHRALANAHILEQSGRVGGKQILNDFNQFLGVSGYQPFKKGAYAKSVKGLTAGTGDALTSKEYKYLEEHVGTIWKGADNVSIKDAQNTKLFIKRGGFEDRGKGMNKSGRHYDDVFGSTVFRRMQNAVAESNPKNLKELKEVLESAEYTEKSPMPGFKIDKETGNVWTNYSFPGSSITEGGVNVVMGIKPNGNFIFTVSDEHDFLEKGVKVAGRVMPGTKRLMKSMLPNRLVAVTPPFSGNLSMVEGSRTLKPIAEESLRRTVKDQDKFNWKEQLTEIQYAVPQSADLAYEQARQQRGIGAGLMSVPTGTND